MGDEDNWLVQTSAVLTALTLMVLFIPVWVVVSLLKGISTGLEGGLEILKGNINDTLE